MDNGKLLEQILAESRTEGEAFKIVVDEHGCPDQATMRNLTARVIEDVEKRLDQGNLGSCGGALLVRVGAKESHEGPAQSELMFVALPRSNPINPGEILEELQRLAVATYHPKRQAGMFFACVLTLSPSGREPDYEHFTMTTDIRLVLFMQALDYYSPIVEWDLNTVRGKLVYERVGYYEDVGPTPYTIGMWESYATKLFQEESDIKDRIKESIRSMFNGGSVH